MANPFRGSVPLQVGDRTYTVSFSVNAICELEEQFDGKPVALIAKGLEDPERVPMKAVRALIWAGLRDHHEEVSLKEAGLLASEAGIGPVMDAIGRAFALAFPDQPEAQKGQRPRTAAAG